MTRVEIYSTALCPYCTAAKDYLARKGVACEEIRIDLDPVMRDRMLSRSGGRRSVPQIFIGDVHVGGYDDLVKADREGRLQGLLEGAT